jgi:hypothetical protein
VTAGRECLDLSPNVTIPLAKGEPATFLALVGGASAADAADAGGITARTVFRRMSEPTYQAQIHALRHAAIGKALNRLTGAASEAVESMLELSRHASSDGVRLRAAIAVLDHLEPLSEHEQVQHQRAVGAFQEALGTEEPTERIIVVGHAPGGFRVLGVVDDAVERLLVPLRGDYEDDVAAALEELSID